MKRKFKIKNPLKKISAIYKIEVEGSDKIYIGETVNVSQRIQKHFSFLRKGKHSNPILQNLFNKYGEEKFIVSILEYIDTKDKITLKNLEIQYQKEIKNCISMDSNEFAIKNRSEESNISSLEALNKGREIHLEEWRIPVIVYNVTTKEHTNYKQFSDIFAFFEQKHAYKNLKEKILIPYKGLVCFYPEEFTEENINKIISAVGNTTNRGEYILYNILSGEIKYFSSKSQFAKCFKTTRHDVYDQYVNCIDEKYFCTKKITSLEELFNMDFMISRSITHIKKCNLKLYYDALLTHKNNVKTAEKLNLNRKYIKTLFDIKSREDRIKEVETLIARVKPI